MNEIIEKYPKIFQDYEGNPGRVNWDCPLGWYKIVDWLCGSIQDYIDNVRHYRDGKPIDKEQVHCSQVKEKYGTLRFYTWSHDQEIEGMIKFAEYLSSITCQECGSMEAKTIGSYWLVTLCQECQEKSNINV